MKRTFYADFDGGRVKFQVVNEEKLLNIARKNGNPDATIEEVIQHLIEYIEKDKAFPEPGLFTFQEREKILTSVGGYRPAPFPNNRYEMNPPCKYCGSEFALLHVTGINYPGESVYFECRNCGARTPVSGTKDDAFELWKDGVLINSYQNAQEETAQKCSVFSVFESALKEIKKRYCFLETAEERLPAYIGSYQGEILGLAHAEAIIRDNDDCPVKHVLNLLDEQIDRYAPEWLDKEARTYSDVIIGIHIGLGWAKDLVFAAAQGGENE
jgi:hypothetical protein